MLSHSFNALNVKALCSSIAIVFIVAFLLHLALDNSAKSPLRYKLLDVSTTVVPPPPVVKQTKATSRPNELAIKVTGQGAAIEIADIVEQPLVTFESPDSSLLNVTPPDVTMPKIEWQGYALNELDSMPSLLTNAVLDIPNELKRRNIGKVTIRLEVSIDPSGRVRLLNIVSNPYAELDFPIKKMVNLVRFSPPVRQGITVKARFIWPVEVEI